MYSCLIAPQGLTNGSIAPSIKCESSDEQSFSRAFYQLKQNLDKQSLPIQQKTNFLSKALPFSHSASTTLTEFKIPMTLVDIEEELAIYLVA